MPVQNIAPQTSYTGNGATTAFATGFQFADASSLTVTLTTAAGLETTLNLGSDYTVTGGSFGTGTVTTTIAPAAGTTLAITRNEPYSQVSTFAANQGLDAVALTGALDRMEMQIQQIRQSLNDQIAYLGGGHIVQLHHDDASGPMYMPYPADRANKLLGFDGSADPIALTPSDASATSVTVPGTGATGRFLADLFSDRVNIKNYGCIGDGVTDCTAGFNAAQTYAAANRKALYIPAGVYYFASAPTGGLPVRAICGDGKELSVLVIEAGVLTEDEDCFLNFAFTVEYAPYGNTMSFTARDFSIRTKGTAGTALKIDNSALDTDWPGEHDRVLIASIQIEGDPTPGIHLRGFAIGFDLVNCAYSTVRDCNFIGYEHVIGGSGRAASPYGYRWTGKGPIEYVNGHPVVVYLERSSAYMTAHGVNFEGCEGAFVTNSVFVECDDAVSFYGQNSVRPHFVCRDNHMNVYSNAVIITECVEATVDNNLIYRIGTATGATTGVNVTGTLAGNGFHSITNNNFFDAGSETTAVLNAIAVYYGSVGYIGGNKFRRVNTAVQLGTGVTKYRVDSNNIYDGVVTSIVDADNINWLASTSLNPGKGFTRQAGNRLETQWGTVAVTLDASGNGAITFAEPFRNALLMGVVSCGNRASTTGTYCVDMTTSTTSALSVAVRPNPGAVAVQFNYIVMGY